MALKMDLSVANGVPVVKDLRRPKDEEVHTYIMQAAKSRNIDPKVALEVWGREGKGAWQSNFTNDAGQREPSYGPYQLLKGGGNSGFPTGLGNAFQEKTGLDPADPVNWKATVDFALDNASSGGWGPWYGARAAGITGMEGIGGNPASFTAGGTYNPTGAPAFGNGGYTPPKPGQRKYAWGGTSEVVQPSSARQMAPNLFSSPLQQQQLGSGAKPALPVSQETGLEGLIQEFSTPKQVAGEVVPMIPQGWTLEEIQAIAQEYGVSPGTVIQMLNGMQK